MDVGGHGYSQFIPNPAKQSAAGFQADATVGFDRCSIGLVVGRLKDPRNAQRITDLLKIVRDRHHELLRLDHTRAENIKRSWSPNFHAPNVEAFHHSKAWSNARNALLRDPGRHAQKPCPSGGPSRSLNGTLRLRQNRVTNRSS